MGNNRLGLGYNKRPQNAVNMKTSRIPGNAAIYTAIIIAIENAITARHGRNFPQKWDLAVDPLHWWRVALQIARLRVPGGGAL